MKLSTALANLNMAYQSAEIVLNAQYPVGQRIRYQMTSTRPALVGEVIQHDRGGLRVKVRAVTGKEYWIHATAIVETKEGA